MRARTYTRARAPKEARGADTGGFPPPLGLRAAVRVVIRSTACSRALACQPCRGCRCRNPALLAITLSAETFASPSLSEAAGPPAPPAPPSFLHGSIRVRARGRMWSRDRVRGRSREWGKISTNELTTDNGGSGSGGPRCGAGLETGGEGNSNGWTMAWNVITHTGNTDTAGRLRLLAHADQRLWVAKAVHHHQIVAGKYGH